MPSRWSLVTGTTVFGLDAGGLLLGAAAALAAGFARGYSGFGMSAILMAILTLDLAPSEVVPIAVLLEIAASLMQIPGIFRVLDFRLLGFLLSGVVIGAPIGVQALATVPPEIMRAALLVLILLASLALLRGIRWRVAAGPGVILGAGFFSGIVNGATGVGGLPIVLFLTLSQTRPAPLRATLIAYLLALDIYTIGLLAHGGLIDAPALGRSGLALPLMAVALWLGGRQFLATTPEAFRRYTLLLLISLSLAGLARAIF